MTVNIASHLKPLSRQVAVRLASLWTITRSDGVALRLTNADRQLVMGGRTFDPDDALNATASSRTEGLEPHNRTIIGVVSAETVTLNELQAGVLRNAEVLEQVVDRRYPWAGPILQKRYVVASVKFTDSRWEADLRTVAGRLQHSAGSLYGRICRFSLGDVKCGVNISQFRTELLTVSDVSFPMNTRTIFEFTSAGYVGSRDAGFANFGYVTFLSGLNAGFSLEVQKEERSGSAVTLTLLDHAPYDIDLGDAFRLTAGCDRALGTCRDKFDNLRRFGGFPFMPGIDAAVQQSTEPQT